MTPAIPATTPARRGRCLGRPPRSNLAALAGLLLLLGSACIDIPVPPAPGGDDTGPSYNTTPVLVPVGVITAYEQERIQVLLQGSDFDGDLLTYRAADLPEGATLDPLSGLFEWVPPPGSSRNSPYQVLFSAFDGYAEATAVGTFVIEPPLLVIRDVQPDRIPAAGGVTLTLTGLGFSSGAQVFVDSRPASMVQVVDAETIRFTAPDLGDVFGPVSVVVSLSDGRSATRYGLLSVFREALDLVGGVSEHVVGEVLFDLRAGDSDGDGDDELFFAGERSVGLIAFEPGEAPAFSTLLDEPGAAVHPANLDPGPGLEAVARTAAGEAVALLPGRTPETLVEGVVGSAIFDLEGDGDDDLVTFSGDGVLRVTAFRSGGQAVAPIVSPPLEATALLGLGDVDGDGVSDALLGSPDGLLVAAGIETGVFVDPAPVGDSAGVSDAHLEVGADGSGELRALNGDEVLVFARRPATGVWYVAERLPLEPVDGARYLIDADGDGDLDVMTVAAGAPGFRIDLLDDDLYSSAGWWLTGAVEGPPLHGDLDGDGRDELVLLTAEGTGLRTIPRNESGFPTAPAGRFTGGGQTLSAGDYNRDGVRDLVVVGTEVEGLPVSVQFPGGRAFGLRGQVSSLPHRAEWVTSAFADTTDDGWIEVIGSDGSDTIDCYASRGGGTFEPPVAQRFDGAVAEITQIFVVNHPDRLLVRTVDGRLFVVDTDGRCGISESTRIAAGIVWSGVDDLDGDGTRELLLAHDDGLVTVHAFSLSGVYLREAEVELGFDAATVALAGGVYDDRGLAVVVVDSSGVRLVSDVLGAAEVSLLDDQGGDAVASGDLDGDGVEEIAVTGGGAPPRLFRGGVRYDLPGWHVAATAPLFADLDGDVDLDLATLEPGFGGVIWWNRPATSGGVPGSPQNE